MNKFFRNSFEPLITIAFFFFGGALAVGVVSWAAMKYPVRTVQVVTSVAPTNPSDAPPLVAKTPTETSSQISEPFEMPVDETKASLDVTWHKAISLDSTDTILRTKLVRDWIEQERPVTLPIEKLGGDASDQYTYNSTFSSVGTVRGGKYNGYNVLIFEFTEDGLGSYVSHFVALQSPDRQYLLLLKNDRNLRRTFFTSAPNLTIPSTQAPKNITLSNGSVLKRIEWSPFGAYEISWADGTKDLTKVAETADGLTLYAWVVNGKSDGCITIVLPDGERVTYESVITDVNSIRWNSQKHASTYQPYIPNGCGGHGCAEVFSDEDVGSLDRLTIVGRTAEGDSIYSPKEPVSHVLVKQAYENWFDYDQAGEKPDMATFLQKYGTPIFFWKDGLGRWVRYIQAEILPQGECGKPVIYLYPEKTMNVGVRLPSFIHVTKSEPTYPSSGWSVVAHPDGTLDMKNGSYGSLYWEGTGVGYSVPKDGFILKDGRVDSDLATILSRYGLNEKESREFRDFWVPKMTGAPYYRVSFLTSEWSKNAPLFVSPRPTTAIRIFMDWQKLSAPISIQEPKIMTPVRNGFTLVEWGGLLRK